MRTHLPTPTPAPFWPRPADLNQAALVQSLITQANALATSIPTSELTTLTAAMLEAVANSIAAMNAIIANSNSVDDVMKVRGGGQRGGCKWDQVQELCSGRR